MNKTELIQKTAERAGITKTAADAAVNSMLEVIIEAISASEKVTVTGFGTFESRTRAPRTCINPKTLKKIDVGESVVPVFKAGSAFRDAVSK